MEPVDQPLDDTCATDGIAIHVPVLELTVVPEIEAYELASVSGNLADVKPL